jgi:hypothetical protein
MTPMSFKKPDIHNMEYLKYAVYLGGELFGYYYFIYNFSNDGKTLIEYSESFDVTNRNIPRKAEYFSSKSIIDLENFTFIKMENNVSNLYFYRKDHNDSLKELKGIFYTETEFDYSNLSAHCTIKTWDGNNIRTQSSRFKLKKGYSYFDMSNPPALLYRMIDSSKPAGIYYSSSPLIFKEPMAASGKIQDKEEDIITPLGNFKVKKVVSAIADPFIGTLMKGFMDKSFMWIDSDGLLVKYSLPFGYGILIEKGLWTNKN